MRHSSAIVLTALTLFIAPSYGQVFNLARPSGLAAEIEFTLINPTTLEIRVKNLTTGVPLYFDALDLTDGHLISTIAFDLGAAGENVGDASITGGSVRVGDTSTTVDFSVANVGAGGDISGEYGYGNNVSSGMFYNFFSGNSAGATAFGGPNLDGTTGLNGPQGGVASTLDPILDWGMIGRVENEIVATLTLDQALADTSFLDNGFSVEFGSDWIYLVPSPSSAALLGLGGLVATRRRRH